MTSSSSENAAEVAKRQHALYTQILYSEGIRIEQKIDELYYALLVFADNYWDLKNTFEKYCAVMTWDDEDGEITKKLRRDTNRHFFNYLASATTLHDHTISFMKEYKNTAFDAEITSHVVDFFPDGLNSTVRAIRNILVHKQFFRFLLKIDARDSESRPTIVLDIPELVSIEKIKKASVQYITSHDGFFDLERFCHEYYSCVTRYYPWLFDKVRKHHHAELAELASLRDELNRCAKVTGDGYLKKEELKYDFENL